MRPLGGRPARQLVKHRLNVLRHRERDPAHLVVRMILVAGGAEIGHDAGEGDRRHVRDRVRRVDPGRPLVREHEGLVEMHGDRNIEVVGRQREVHDVRNGVPFVHGEIYHPRRVALPDGGEHADIEDIELGVLLSLWFV